MFGIEVSPVEVLVSAVVAMIIGAIWYSNSLFGKEWRVLVGLSEEDVNNAKFKMPLVMGLSTIAFLVMAYVLANVIPFTGATTIIEGVQTGFWLWIGFVATSMIINILFQGRQLKLFIIDSFYMLIVLLSMGGIIVVL